MILLATWQGAGRERRREIRFRTPLGFGTAWVEERRRRGEFLLELRVQDDHGYVEPGRFSALGAVSFCNIPELAGRGSRLRLTAIPGVWQSAGDAVTAYLGRLRIKATILGRTLEMADASMAPSELIERAGVALFALDSFARGFATPGHFKKVRHAAVRLFGDSSDEVLALLDEARGERNLRNFLRGAMAPRSETRERSIASALGQIGSKTLVQFDCGLGWLLSGLGGAAGLKRIIGIEASTALVDRAKARLGGILDVRHGSLIDPPANLPCESTALLVDALFAPDDMRLKRASQVLFHKIGFEFVLCVQGDLWSPPQLQAWAERVGSEFSYRVACWKLGRGSAVLFRRTRKTIDSEVVQPVLGREVMTGVGRSIRIEASQWRSTIEVFGRWTVDPRWLIYLPPGMPSLQSDQVRGPLEHPTDAFSYYRDEGISKLVVEFKHMGSRATVVACRDEEAGQRRFGMGALGCIYTRNGRPFLKDGAELLRSISNGLARSRFWERFKTDWVCLDGELLPWSLKAEKLLEHTHGEVLSCGEAVLSELAAGLGQLAPEESSYLDRRQECFRKYRALYEHYQAVDRSVRFAPFHLIATEGRSYFDENHLWHMQTLGALARHGGDIFLPTPHRFVSLGDQRAVEECMRWWDQLSESGEEGVVVKPLYFVPRGRRGFAQPAIKCRGAEHLRLVYGPEYDLPENRLRLVDRAALKRRREKHRRVLRQFALSVEGVERFVRGDGLDRVTECVRGVIALESRDY